MKYSKSRKYMGQMHKVKGHSRKVYVRRARKWDVSLNSRVNSTFLDLTKSFLKEKEYDSWWIRKIYQ